MDSCPTTFFIRKSASNKMRPTSVLPNLGSTIRSGSLGLRFTQNVDGGRLSQT